MNSVHLPQKDQNRAVLEMEMQLVRVFEILREKVCLLSRFLVNRTVDSRLSKKESCSTWRGLCVGTGFGEFR